MNTPEKILSRLTQAVRETYDEAAFEPLDKNVESELQTLYEVQARALYEDWKENPDVPRPKQQADEDIEAWRSDLTKARVAEYLSAAAALMRRLLLESGSGELRIESVSEEPYVEVRAALGSTLAEEQRLDKTRSVRVHLHEVARHISMRCDVPDAWGEYAWRAIATSVANAPHCLPRLNASMARGNAIQVSRAG